MGYFYLLVEQFGIILFLNKLELIQNKNNSKTIEILDESCSIKKKILSYIKDTSLVCISAQVIIFPIIAYNYKTLSLTFVITNILTSYLIGVIIIFGFILVLISFPFLNLAKFIGSIYKLIIDLLLFITQYTSKLPFSKIYIKAPYFWEIVLYYILIFSYYYLFQKYRKARTVAKIKANILQIKTSLYKSYCYNRDYFNSIYIHKYNSKRITNIFHRCSDKVIHALL